MLVSFKWLKEFVDIEQSPEEIAELLTMGGIEIESVTWVGKELASVVTARVEEVAPHGDSGKLRTARINLGKLECTVLCGAPNVAAGQITAYAGPGVTLPSGLIIEEKVIQGFSSPGMLCSEKELGLTDDAAGILVLPDDTPIGVPLTQALPFVEDCILETSVTPNRGDCLSILGTAREVAALLRKPWRLPEFTLAEGDPPIQERLTLEVPAAEDCPRYVARMVQDIRIAPSELATRVRLTRSGVRPISNVVDVTNIVLLECGQPLHAFDYDLLEGHKIVVRRCEPGDTFTTLDGVERKLPPNALMIRDGARPVALAGVMGGLNSEINDGTTRTLIESACFEPFGVRRTSKALGLSTEASFRFERGVDPVGSLWAANRCAYLTAKAAGGVVLRGYLDAYPTPIVRRTIGVRPTKINEILGTDLKTSAIRDFLLFLGIGVEEQGEGLVCHPPSWRWDLEREVDIAEETARMLGFDNIPITLPRIDSLPDDSRHGHGLVTLAADLMTASGFLEIITMSFVSQKEAGEFNPTGAEPPVLLNPLTEDYTHMRTSLIPGLLQTAKRNINFRNEDLKLYEVGKTFTAVSGADLPREDLKLAVLLTGLRRPLVWNERCDEDVDFFDVKGALENLLEGFGLEAKYAPSTAPFLHPGKSADVLLNGLSIGYVGELVAFKAREHDLDKKLYISEISLEPMFENIRNDGRFVAIPRYPFIERDLSIIVEEKVSSDMIKRLISHLGHDIIRSVNLFDLYRGESIPKGRRSLAFRIRYQSEDRTLTDEDVQRVHSHVLAALGREFGASVRE